MLLYLGLENHHWTRRLFANSARLCLNLGKWERKPLIVMQKVKDIQKRFKIKLKLKTFLTVKLNLYLIIEKMTSIHDTNGNNDIVEIKTPSISRMEKVETTIPTTYYNEKKDVC